MQITDKLTPNYKPLIVLRDVIIPLCKHANMENEINYLVANVNCKEALFEFHRVYQIVMQDLSN